MATLTGKKVKDTYKSLLKLEGDTGSPVAGASGNAVQVKTGDNDATALYLNTDRVGVGVADPDQALEVAGKIHISDEAVSAPSAPGEGDGGIIYTKADGKPYWISYDVADVALTNTVAVSADLDFGGYYSLDEQGRTNHVANTMPAPYYRFDGTNDYISTGTNKWTENDPASFAIWVYPIGSSEVSLFNTNATSDIYIDGDEKVQFRATASNYIYSSGTVTRDAWNHVVCTQTSTARAIYINGVLQTVTDVSSGHTTAFNSATNASYIGYVGNQSHGYMDGSISDVKFFNNALTATEVKELYSGASVPFKYKGANQTDLIEANDAGSGTAWTGATGTTPPDGWTSGGSSRTFTIDSLSGSGAEPAIKVTAGSGNAWLKPNFNLTLGKKYRLEFIYKNTAGDEAYYNVTSGVYVELASSTSWSSVQSVEFTATTTDNFTFLAWNTGDIVWFDNVSLTQIGAVAEYDGSGVGATRWDDKSGNALHGTVTGATVENAPADADSGLTYEEGTWTPVMVRATGGAITATYDIQGATYTKIGNLVTVNCYIITTSVTDSGSSLNLVSGLPFNVSSTDYQGVGSVQFNTAFTSTVAHSVTAYTGDDVSFGHVASKLYGSIGEAWVAGALSFTLTYRI